MPFLVIPAVDLKDGKCVRLVQGDPKKQTVELENPLEVARGWEALGAKRLHLVDLDGALEGFRKNERIVKEIVSTLSIPVQFGGGIRSLKDAKDLLEFGVEKIILGTAAMDEPTFLAKLQEEYGKERLIIALDSKKGRVVTKGWILDTGALAVEAAKTFEGLASECLYTNVDVEGKVEGPDIGAIKKIVEATTMNVIASGGISSVEDIKSMKDTGAAGVVIGTALYKKKIDFKEALELEDI
jgi:phosphoribosylformimino-5-aminoimidazole carboxamide ribotide isomerase